MERRPREGELERRRASGSSGAPGPSNVEIVDYHEGAAMAVTAIHPGQHLAEELRELGMSAAELARRLDVPANLITGILNGQRAITGDGTCSDCLSFGGAFIDFPTFFWARRRSQRLC